MNAIQPPPTAIYLSFSGGSGTPLVISFTDDIIYTISFNPTPGTFDPYFVFDEIGNIYSGSQTAVISTGAPVFTGVDGPGTINNISSGESWGAITPNDVKIRATAYAGSTPLYLGETFTLSAGTLTTSIVYSGTLPTDGLYSTFIVDPSYNNLGQGSAIPEPSTYAVFAGLGVLGFVAGRRRKSA